MKKYIYISTAAVILALILVITIQAKRNKNIKADRDIYKSNTEVLISQVKQYQTKEALNVASISVLELRLSEYEKYKPNEAALIKSFEIREYELQNVITSHLETISEIKGMVKDSLIYIDRIVVDTLRCIDIKRQWTEFTGCINKFGEFDGVHKNRESLLIAATTKYKRFCGFLWRTKKIEDRKIDVTSRNPATTITHVDYIEIRK